MHAPSPIWFELARSDRISVQPNSLASADLHSHAADRARNHRWSSPGVTVNLIHSPRARVESNALADGSELGTRVGKSSSRSDVAVRRVRLDQTCYGSSNSRKRRRRAAEGAYAEVDVARVRQVNEERFFSLLRVTGECPVGEPATVTSFLGVDHSAGNREMQRSEAGTEDHDGAGSGYLSSAHGCQARHAMHLPAEEPLGGELESVVARADHDVAKRMAVARRQ